MLWAFAAAGATGVLLGLWFRVAALVAVSVMTAAACLPAAVLAGVGLLLALGFAFACLGALQVGYLAGLMLFCAWRGARVLSADLPMLGNDERPSRSGHRTR